MDMETLMANAKNLQAKIAEAQESLGKMRVKGISGNGAVIVDMTGKYDLLSVKLREDVAGRSAKQISEIFLAAYTDAKTKADTVIDSVMGDATAGMPLPE